MSNMSLVHVDTFSNVKGIDLVRPYISHLIQRGFSILIAFFKFYFRYYIPVFILLFTCSIASNEELISGKTVEPVF